MHYYLSHLVEIADGSRHANYSHSLLCSACQYKTVSSWIGTLTMSLQMRLSSPQNTKTILAANSQGHNYQGKVASYPGWMSMTTSLYYRCWRWPLRLEKYRYFTVIIVLCFKFLHQLFVHAMLNIVLKIHVQFLVISLEHISWSPASLTAWFS